MEIIMKFFLIVLALSTLVSTAFSAEPLELRVKYKINGFSTMNKKMATHKCRDEHGVCTVVKLDCTSSSNCYIEYRIGMNQNDINTIKRLQAIGAIK
jgi:hypothetical protein